MIPTLRYLEHLILTLARYAIDESMLTSNTPRPPGAQKIFKGLWFPEPLKWIELDVSYKVANAVKMLLVALLFSFGLPDRILF
jgi:hypothetical protein